MSHADDVVAIEQVVRRSADHNDRREWHALAALYDIEATLTRPSGDRITGREAIEAAYAAGPADRRTRHLCGGTVVEIVEPGVARATTPVLLFTWQHSEDTELPAATGPAVGAFADVLVRSGSGWVIRERVATLAARVGAGGG